MADLSVIYYTSNREKSAFEDRIRKTLWHTIKPLRLPLISVSQKPLDFGENICVGDVGASSQNAYRQLQLGALAAKTKFVCCAEADFLYPREYFEFRPRRLNTFYVASPLWVLFAHSGRSHVYVLKPRGSEAAMVVGREALINRIEEILGGVETWGATDANGESMPYLIDHQTHFDTPDIRRATFEIGTPIISFKTDQQMHRKTPHRRSSKTRGLPHWGTAAGLIKRYIG